MQPIVIPIIFPAFEEDAGNGVMLTRTYAIMSVNKGTSRIMMLMSPKVAQAVIKALHNDGKLVKPLTIGLTLNLGDENKRIKTHGIEFPSFLLKRVENILQSVRIDAYFSAAKPNIGSVITEAAEETTEAKCFSVFQVSLQDKIAQLVLSVLGYRQMLRKKAEEAEQAAINTEIPVQDAYESIRKALNGE